MTDANDYTKNYAIVKNVNILSTVYGVKLMFKRNVFFVFTVSDHPVFLFALYVSWSYLTITM